MRALVLTAPSQLELLTVPTPEPADDEVVIRIRACGICGSDIHGWDGSSGRRRPPLIMGHEAAGEIADVGRAVRGWQRGDRVTFDSTIYCGTCPACLAGQVNLCTTRRVVGVAPADYSQPGAFAEFLALPARILHRLPAALPFPHAAMVEPVAIALHAAGRLGPTPPASAVVVGAGMIGLLVIQALRSAGVKTLIAVDLASNRLELASRLGATHALNPRSTDVLGAVLRLTDGQGAESAFEVVGAEPTLDLALQAVRRGGAVVLVGNLAPRVGFPLQAVVTRELRVLGSCGSAGEYPRAIELIARGEIQVPPLISAVDPLDDGPEWFARLSEPGGTQFLKVILAP